MIVVSFYTPNTIYEERMRTLKASVEKFKLRHDIQPVEDKGSWRKNVSYKPTFLLEMLKKHKEPILWVDADGVFRQAPKLLYNTNCDVAYFYWDMVGFRTICTGTLYFANTDMAFQILKAWETLDKAQSTTESGQIVLTRTLEQNLKIRLNSTILLLPMSYLWCNFLPSLRTKYLNEIEPVIEHSTTQTKVHRVNTAKLKGEIGVKK